MVESVGCAVPCWALLDVPCEAPVPGFALLPVLVSEVTFLRGDGLALGTRLILVSTATLDMESFCTFRGPAGRPGFLLVVMGALLWSPAVIVAVTGPNR